MSVKLLFCGLALGAGLSGCVFTPGDSSQHMETFSQALGICRLQQPGRVNRRVHLPPTHQGVARCLKRRGWNTDGSRMPLEVSSARSPQRC